VLTVEFYLSIRPGSPHSFELGYGGDAEIFIGADLESKLGHEERAVALNREVLAINRAAGYKQGEAQNIGEVTL
jgi:hypothetical protein